MAPNAHVTLDADLMTQTVACSVFSSDNAASFSAISDGQSKPLLFSVSHDGHFYLLHADNSIGKKPLVDLNECFGLPTDATVTAYAVTQDKSGIIYLAFSTAAAASTTTVYVVKPTTASDWASVKAGENLTSWFLSTGSTWQGDRVTEFYMVRCRIFCSSFFSFWIALALVCELIPMFRYDRAKNSATPSTRS